MKKLFFAVSAFAAMAGMLLSGAERVPLLWENTKTPYRDFQTYAFGFLEERNEYTFVFQIKNLPGFLEKERPFITCYFNSDNDVMTGLYPEKGGWDLQFNLDLKRNTLSALFWRSAVSERFAKLNKGNGPARREHYLESSYTFSKGEFQVRQSENLLFLTVRKNIYFKNIRFDRKKFQFAQFIASPDLERKKYSSYVETAQEAVQGVYKTRGFDLPEE